MSARTMNKSDFESSSLKDPFKGRTLVRSPRNVQTISIQYDYQNTTPPQSTQRQVRRESIKEESPPGTKSDNRVSKVKAGRFFMFSHVPHPLILKTSVST